MKKLHLLCNAHLDPVWLWRWNEGLAETLSTFRVAADFCENYDGFVFNHNEAVLYEWVEEYEPELFERIKKLVKEKKWVIMGGWYIQSDCVMPSGESLMEQINLGREYFKSKFGVEPKTAINFDPFGHTRGLVQILKKNGFSGYLFMRPMRKYGDFIWEGYDGSRIHAHGMVKTYSSLKGQALGKIKDYIEGVTCDTGLCLWGIGNHGGGPSRVDLEEINEFIKESDIEIVHSDADTYFSEIKDEDLNVISESLIPSNVGCYTSMVRIKQANRRVENKIAVTEKIMNYVQMSTGEEGDLSELKKAKKTLAFCQFHDILPGTSIKPAEDDSLKALNYAEEILDKLHTKAFLKLCDGQKPAKDGEIPVMIFNPHPYEIDGVFEVGFILQNQNWTEDEYTVAKVYDENGNELPTQNEKPEATIHLDWTKKISFSGTLKPASITRFDVKLEVVKVDTLKKAETDGDIITVSNGTINVSVSKKTGLIENYEVLGKSYIKKSGKLEVYKDNEDPWGMRTDSFKELIGEFTLMSDKDANEFFGYPEENFPNVRITESGDVRTKIQAIFEYKRSVAVVDYTIPAKGNYIDVYVTIFSNEPNNMIKYTIGTNLKGEPYGSTAFGFEKLYDDEKECVYHKWCGIKEKDDGLYVINNGIYGGSFTNDTIKLSLLRTVVYSTHPIAQRQLAPHDRFLNHIDMGERHFSFRITTEKDVARQAQMFNEPPQCLSFFPSGKGEKPEFEFSVDNPCVILSSVKKNQKGYTLYFYNESDNENQAKVEINGKTLELSFGKHELKFVEI